MAFIYKSSGTKLKSNEEQLLEDVDNFTFPLKGYSNLAQLHLRIEVILSDKGSPRQFEYTITNEQRNKIISELDREEKTLSKLFEAKRAELFKNISQDIPCEKLEKEVSRLEKLLGDLYIQKCNFKNAIPQANEFKIIGETELLGLYDPQAKQVILYRESIKNACSKYGNSMLLLAVVYVHEMMHAYLDCGGITLPEIEEPIVEYAMLNFFNAFNKNICVEAENHVKEKQQIIGIAHYGFGYCLFKNSNGVDWLEDYRKAKSSSLLNKTNTDVKDYLDFWKTGVYPFKKENQVLESLYKALHPGAFKKMKVKPASIVIIEQSKDKNDLIRKLDNYLAKHSPITPLANAVIPNDHSDWLYMWWKDSSARQYYDWLDPTKHSELIPLLNKHGLYGSIYMCVDLQQIANIYKELVDKTTPEAIKAYGNSENMVSAIRHFIEHLLEINHITL